MAADRVSAERFFNAAFVAVLIIVILDGLSMGIIFPILPALVDQLVPGQGEDAARALGLLSAIWAVANFLAAPVLGMLSDRIGRKPVIILSGAGLALDFVIMALAPNLFWLVLGRALSGLCAATVATAFAYTTDISPPALRVARFGWVNACFMAGLVLGPALGGLLGTISLRFPFWASAALVTASVLFAMFALPRPIRAAPPEDKPGLLSSMRMMARPTLLRLGLTFLLIKLAERSANVLLVLYAMEHFGWSMQRVGIVVTGYAVGSGAALVLLAPRLARRLGEANTLRLGLGLAVLGCVGFALSRSASGFLLAGAVICSAGILVPALQALLARQVGEHEQGRLQGLLAALGALAGVAGPLLFAQVYSWSMATFSGPSAPGLVFYAAAGVVGAALLLSFTDIGCTRPDAREAPGG